MEGKQKSLQNILFVYLIKNVKLRQNKIIFLTNISHFCQNWATYGLDQHDRVRDEINFHNEIATFALFMLIMMYICHYKKDPYRKDWARREATILVLEREEAGLPYIDMNYVDPKKLLENLPTEEELEGTQVYI